MDIWQLIVAMIIGGVIMGIGVLLGAAAALGSRTNKDSEDIDIP